MKQAGKGLLPRMAWAVDGANEFLGHISGVAIVAAAVIITESVVVRFLGVSTIWQLELSIYLLMMATFVAAGYTQKYEGHVGIDLITYYVPPKPREIIHLIGSIFGFIVAIVIAWYAWPLWWESVEFGYRSESLWSPPLSFPYILLPLGMTFLALQYLVYIGRKIALLKDLFRGGKAPPPPEPPCYHEPLPDVSKIQDGGQG